MKGAGKVAKPGPSWGHAKEKGNGLSRDHRTKFGAS